jgi:ABC-type antimicrobial peptide transport system permease subunit
MAVGADVGRLRRMVVRQGLGQASLGVAIGIGLAALASRTLGDLLFGVQPLDLTTYAAVASLMVLVAGFAAWMPALRATRVDPSRALSEG